MARKASGSNSPDGSGRHRRQRGRVGQRGEGIGDHGPDRVAGALFGRDDGVQRPVPARRGPGVRAEDGDGLFGRPGGMAPAVQVGRPAGRRGRRRGAGRGSPTAPGPARSWRSPPRPSPARGHQGLGPSHSRLGLFAAPGERPAQHRQAPAWPGQALGVKDHGRPPAGPGGQS